MINDFLSPPCSKLTPSVFDDPRGHRRRIVTAVGVVVCVLCLCVLALGGGVLYADPKAPATGPVQAVRTLPLR
ncbi:hypothetical protein GCM10010319_24890 [Streptomyces blastmyceticus]|uniref:Uncharacterized protein n=1 Tax=Streptomyces blastmyceticus TaxID=68180 RepID=A0ABN0WUZ3_9ACTN